MKMMEILHSWTNNPGRGRRVPMAREHNTVKIVNTQNKINLNKLKCVI